MSERFVGIQFGAISVADEGAEQLVGMFDERFGVTALMLGTVSWLALKVGRRVSHELEGWPDHGVPNATPLRGGSFLTPRPEYYRSTFIDRFRADDEELAGVDILEAVLPHAAARGLRTYADLMEPMFNYSGHGSTVSVDVPNLPQVLQIDSLGRATSEPCLNSPDYRNWLHALVEDHCRSYPITGIMWCNERRSPIDAALTGKAPHCFCRHCTQLAADAGIDVERARVASHALWETASSLRQGARPSDGAFVEILRTLYNHPEALVWERFWVERNKALDRELYGIVKFCDPRLEFGLNVWNRNHFNPWRKAQWPWAEQAEWSDWVKPIVYQHQSGGIFSDEWTPLLETILRDLDPDHVIELVKDILGLKEARWADIVQVGLDPDTYVFGQAKDTLDALDGKLPVYMGIGVDAPRSRVDQAVCTPDIVRRSVLATYKAGAHGVIYGPAYAGMSLENLDAGADALRELGLLGASA